MGLEGDHGEARPIKTPHTAEFRPFRAVDYSLHELLEIDSITQIPSLSPVQTAYFAAKSPYPLTSRRSLTLDAVPAATDWEFLSPPSSASRQSFQQAAAKVIVAASREQQLFALTPSETSLSLQSRRIVTGGSFREPGVKALVNLASTWGCSNGRP